jgi:hypothetical protein
MKSVMSAAAPNKFNTGAREANIIMYTCMAIFARARAPSGHTSSDCSAFEFDAIIYSLGPAKVAGVQ